MKNFKKIYIIIAVILILQSCAVIRPGEAGIDTHYGKLKPKVLQPGPHHFFALFGRKIVRFNTRVINYTMKLNFHTEEGIEVSSETTILYHVIPDSIISIYRRFGLNYQEMVITDNLINTLRHLGLNYKATELITARTAIEDSIKTAMHKTVGKYGFVIDLVMLKEVDLPEKVVQTIQAKLNAEETAKKTKIDNDIKREILDFELEKQRKESEMDTLIKKQMLAFELEKKRKEAELEILKQRLVMDFAIEKQKMEAQRMLIEAEAIKRYQGMIDSTLTTNLLKLKSLEITRELMNSNNAKIIITDGKSPVWIKD